MIDKGRFETLLKLPESAELDFKRDMYDLSKDDAEYSKTGRMAKDIISFINTIRLHTSYIIFGVEAHDDGSKVLKGITKGFDDAIIQDKIKDKIIPTPIFESYIFEHEGLKYGILEFPVKKYSSFLTSTIKMKSVDAGAPYYRLGTTNQEAKGHKLLEINEWIKTITIENSAPLTKREWVIDLLHLCRGNDMPLSEVILEALEFSLEHNIESLQKFCTTEIQGLEPYSTVEVYRAQNINYCYGRFDPLVKEPQAIWERRLLNEGNFFQIQHILDLSVTEIENHIKQIVEEDNQVVIECTLRYFKKELDDTKQITVFLQLTILKELLLKIRNQLQKILTSVL